MNSDRSVSGTANMDSKLDASSVIEHINSVLPTYASLKALQLVFQSSIAQTKSLIREYQIEISDPFLERLENTEKCLQTAFEVLATRMTAGERDVSNALHVMQAKLNKVDNEIRVIVDKDQVKQDLHAVLETMTTLKRDVEHLSTLIQSASVLGDLSGIQTKLGSVDALVTSQKSLIASMNNNVSLHTASLTQLHAQINRVSQYFGDYQVPSPFASLSEYLTSFSHVPSTLQSIELRIGGLSKHCMELVKTIGVDSHIKPTKATVLDTCASTQSNVDAVDHKLSLLDKRVATMEDTVSGSNNVNIPTAMSVMKTEMELMKLAMKHYETVIADMKHDIQTLKECSYKTNTNVHAEFSKITIAEQGADAFPRSPDQSFELVVTPRVVRRAEVVNGPDVSDDVSASAAPSSDTLSLSFAQHEHA
jgi:uncharacterized coiled-coil protein SlyX